MTLPFSFADPTYRIYLTLSQFPILQTKIRSRMRKQLYERGIISSSEFKDQVRQQAIDSQGREGLHGTHAQEAEDIWKTRNERIRAYLTDLYFANNLSIELFEGIVSLTLEERGAQGDDYLETINLQMAPIEVLVEQAQQIISMSGVRRERFTPRLEEIRVTLIRNMISDQLAYIKIAKKWFTIEDLINILNRRVGKGKIGGKAAGMLLAHRIIQEVGDEELKNSVKFPESYFLAADVMYAFMAYNNLMHRSDQKYKSTQKIKDEYPQIQKEYAAGHFPSDIQEELQEVLEKIGNKPIIVRSSSLLEDNFGTSFAGKYDSFFLPNQGTLAENLKEFTKALSAIYASGINPDALLYRRANDLQDYDERIAILIQEVQGERLGDYFLPHAAGVAFSRNLYRWSPEIERDAGFLRLVWGMGTRAVDRVGNDYPRLVALSHPMLHAHSDPKSIMRYSQKDVDVIDLEKNSFLTLPIHDVLNGKYSILRYIAQSFEDDYLSPIRSNVDKDKLNRIVITMDELLKRTNLATLMKRMLQTLAKHYKSPVDMEFTIRIDGPNTLKPSVDIQILQCRPQSHMQDSHETIPSDIDPKKIVFSTGRILPQGKIEKVKYILFVTPEGYYSLPSQEDRIKLGREIGKINGILEEESFICIGPGRWGTTNPDLGVRITYADIFHSKALIELSGAGVGTAPEPSFGTHFFQDLLESKIYPLAIFLDDEDVIFNQELFYESENSLEKILEEPSEFSDCLRIIDVEKFMPNHTVDIVMDGEIGKAVAYFNQNK
jgi:hypothetical protein